MGDFKIPLSYLAEMPKTVRVCLGSHPGTSERGQAARLYAPFTSQMGLESNLLRILKDSLPSPQSTH